MVSNTIVILLLLGLNLESFSQGMRYGASFWLMQFSCAKMQRQKSGLCGLKG